MSHKFFLSNPSGDGFETFATIEERDAAALVAALRAQLHTETEQRQFVSNLIDNMPHAQIAADLSSFKAEVAAALRELRANWQSALSRYNSQIGKKSRDALTFERWQELNGRLEELDATIAALGIETE